MLARGIAFRLGAPLPPEAELLLQDFRLVVNEAIRVAIQSQATSRNALTKLAYKGLRVTHPGMYAQHLASAFEVAASALKNHRRRVRHGKLAGVPFVRRLMIRAENQAYRLDREAGMVDLPIRAGCHVKLRLIVSRYHRRYLDDESLSLGSLTLLPDRVVIVFRKNPPTAFTPATVLSLDTNERSLDCVFVEDSSAAPVLIAFPKSLSFNRGTMTGERGSRRRRPMTSACLGVYAREKGGKSTTASSIGFTRWPTVSSRSRTAGSPR
jgi:hypothetical protein